MMLLSYSILTRAALPINMLRAAASTTTTCHAHRPTMLAAVSSNPQARFFFLPYILHSSLFLLLHSAFMFIIPRRVEPRASSLCCWHPTRFILFTTELSFPSVPSPQLCLFPSFQPPASGSHPAVLPTAPPTALSSQPSSSASHPPPLSMTYTQPCPSL